MIGSIFGAGASYSYYNMYRSMAAQRSQNVQSPAPPSAQAPAQGPQRSGGVWGAQRAASPETPVQPVSPASIVGPDRTQSAALGLPIRMGADPAEMAVRMRIQPYDESSNIFLSEEDAAKAVGSPASGVESAQEALEAGQCETCEQRKYQDGSDDMGVSFQTPTRVDPDMAASAVRGHENEHVVREQAKAQREDRKVVSQSVTLHTDICPECGKVYVSGGTTRTTTAANPEEENPDLTQDNKEQQRTPFSVLA